MKYADIIVPKGAENDIAIQFITDNLKNKLKTRGVYVQWQPPTTLQIEKLPFPLIDEVLLNFSTFSSQMKTVDPKSLKDSLLEKVITRIYLGLDNDILQIHYNFLSKELLSLFKSVNPDFNLNSGKW
jgi:hypothetical protein